MGRLRNVWFWLAHGENLSVGLRPVFDGVQPRSRKKLADRLMRFARRANADRSRRNVEPDGGTMAKRLPRKGPKTGARGKMFRNIGKIRSLKIKVTPDHGELYFHGGAGRTAETHHFGEEGFVGKTREGKIIRTKYDARRLLGFGKEQNEYLDQVLEHLGD